MQRVPERRSQRSYTGREWDDVVPVSYPSLVSGTPRGEDEDTTLLGDVLRRLSE